MRPTMLVVPLMLVLAGCTASSDRTHTSGPTESGDTASSLSDTGTSTGATTSATPNKGPLHANGTYSSTITSLESPAFDYSGNGPCIGFPESQVSALVAGRAVAIWDATNPAWSSLRLFMLTSDGEIAGKTGPSPLTIELTPQQVEEEFIVGLKPNLDGQKDGIVVDQPIQIQWELTYEGKSPVEPEKIGC